MKSGRIYPYGFEIVKMDMDQFYAERKHTLKPLKVGYEPNPYAFQYDLEVHMFLNYNTLVARQEAFLEETIRSTKDLVKRQRLELKLEQVRAHGTGIPRAEHFWNAAQLRWPTEFKGGKEVGLFVREPWGEDFLEACCDYQYVYMFGGSGQGKTHRALAFMCVLWDHYIDHQMGGRCRFSTVAEDKIKESAWPYLQRIYAGSTKGISLYCGRGLVHGEYTITRPHDKKGGGSIKGILIPRRGDAVGVDKITGSHGHPVGVYHIDEAQSTPEAPFEASPNFLQNCTYGWITASGNYNLNNDALGKNVKPVNGWDSVDESTHRYECVNMLGIRSAAIHYNNDLSPAFDGEGARRWGHMLPTKAKREAQYPTEQSKRTNAYRRLWIGWREKVAEHDSVLNKVTLRETGAMRELPNWDYTYPVTHGWSFDSAPTSTDRNIVTHFADGIDLETGKWKIHFYETVGIEKINNVDQYLELCSNELLKLSKKWGVNSGNGIMDWTNITGIPERLKEKGFLVRTVVYNQAPPNGRRRDTRTKSIHPEVCVDGVGMKYAHQECTNYIAMGALLLQNFVINAQVSGLHEGYINSGNSDRSYEEELCLRKFQSVTNKELGELTALEPKHSKHGRTGFTKTNGFSPDILDSLFQAAIFCAIYRGMVPGLFGGAKSTYRHPDTSNDKTFVEKHEKFAEHEHTLQWAELSCDHYCDDQELIDSIGY